MSAPSSPRSTAQRIADARARLGTDVDAWVATAPADGSGPHLVPLSFVWRDERLTFATAESSATVRNLRSHPVAKVALGHTRDVVLLDGDVSFTALHDVDDDLAEAYLATGWDPRQWEENVWFHVSPVRVQVWREADETAGRVVMRDGRWLA